MASESSIQSSILEYINKLPKSTAENVSGNAQQSGRADINACIEGRTFKIEVKTEDTAYGRKGATTKQRLYLEKWARAGAFSCVVYNLDDVKFAIALGIRREIALSGYRIRFEENGNLSFLPLENLKVSGRGKWYDVENKRWVNISY